MARQFATASSQYLSLASSPLSTGPMSISLWARRDSDPGASPFTLFSLSRDTDSTREIALRIDTGSPYKVTLNLRASSTNVLTTSAGGTTSGQWHHIAGVVIAFNNRNLFLDNVKANTTTSNTPTSLDILSVGAGNRGGSYSSYHNGAIAGVGMWNVALSDAEVANLYNNGIGLDPRSVRPDALVAYWPLLNNDGDQDYWGNAHLTASGSPTYAKHPPVLMRSRPKYVILGSAAPSIATIEIAGTRQVGNTLTCNATSSPSGATFTYQWYMADDIGGTNQTAISGATSQTYELSYANIGAATKLYEGLDANAEAFIACGATPTKDAVEGDETVSSYVSITEAAVTASTTSPFESLFIR